MVSDTNINMPDTFYDPDRPNASEYANIEPFGVDEVNRAREALERQMSEDNERMTRQRIERDFNNLRDMAMNEM